MDGVTTMMQVTPGSDAGPIDAHGHRRGPDQGDGLNLIDFSGTPLSGHAGGGARGADHRQIRDVRSRCRW